MDVIAADRRRYRRSRHGPLRSLPPAAQTPPLQTPLAQALATGAAVSGIGGEVAAAVDGAAILDTDRAVRALADAAAALDGNEPTLANLAARATVVHIRLEIDADTAAVGQTGLTGQGVALPAARPGRLPRRSSRPGARAPCGVRYTWQRLGSRRRTDGPWHVLHCSHAIRMRPVGSVFAGGWSRREARR